MIDDDVSTQTLSASYKVAQIDAAYEEYLKAKRKSEQRCDRQITWSVRLSVAAIVIVALATLAACAEGINSRTRNDGLSGGGGSILDMLFAGERLL